MIRSLEYGKVYLHTHTLYIRIKAGSDVSREYITTQVSTIC